MAVMKEILEAVLKEELSGKAYDKVRGDHMPSALG
jgi:hypothetical protein